MLSSHLKMAKIEHKIDDLLKRIQQIVFSYGTNGDVNDIYQKLEGRIVLALTLTRRNIEINKHLKLPKRNNVTSKDSQYVLKIIDMNKHSQDFAETVSEEIKALADEKYTVNNLVCSYNMQIDQAFSNRKKTQEACKKELHKTEEIIDYCLKKRDRTTKYERKEREARKAIIAAHKFYGGKIMIDYLNDFYNELTILFDFLVFMQLHEKYGKDESLTLIQE